MNTRFVLKVMAVALVGLSPIATSTGSLAQRFAAPTNYPTADTYRCNSELGHLRRVYEQELGGVRDPLRVWVTPVCEGESGFFRTEGNAGALRAGIAKNKAMRQALGAANFRPEDVVAVRMTGTDSLILYVHPFHK